MAGLLPFFAFLHARLAVALILMAILLGLLGSFDFLRRHAVGPGFRAGYLLMAGLTAIQSLAGLAQLAAGGHLHNVLHVVYGIFAVAFLPGVLVYVSRGDRAREAAFLTMACWIVLIAFFRGRATGMA